MHLVFSLIYCYNTPNADIFGPFCARFRVILRKTSRRSPAGNEDIMSTVTFEELGISENLLAAIRDLGYAAPTPIQAEAIGKLTRGYDVVGQSQTGTGKTAAFGIPLIQLIDPEDRRLQGVVLCPTRELCLQVTEEFHRLLKYSEGIRTVAVYGGQPIDRQINALKGGVQIIVATPGRFMDHLRRHTIKLNTVQMVVLDEADEMLGMGFLDDMDLILSQMPNPRQTVLFSATMPEPIAKLAEKYTEDPVRITLTPKEQLTVDEVTQLYYEMKAKMKPEALCRILTCEKPARALVFCNTKKQSDELAHFLKSRDYRADCLHGDLNQSQRDTVMKAFRSGEIKILVATDIAARGLDVNGIELVVNYELPEEDEAYVHRIGRTARAGAHGKACSFVVGRELDRLRELMAYTGTDMTPQRIPTLQDVEQAHTDKLLTAVRERLEKGISAKYQGVADSLIAEGHNPNEVVAALIAEALYVPETAAKGVLPINEEDESRTPTRVSGKGYEKSGLVKLFINAGRAEKLRVKDVVGAIAGGTGIPGSAIGEITILEHFTYVQVPAELSADIITIMNGVEIKGRKIRIEKAMDTNNK